MENQAQKIAYNVHYQILECCFIKKASEADIVEYLKRNRYIVKHVKNLTESILYIEQLLKAKLIEKDGDNYFQISPEGMSAYLSIQSQKQSARQARWAIYIAAISILIAIATLIATIVY